MAGCSQWAREGYCSKPNYAEYMQMYCPLSCRKCKIHPKTNEDDKGEKQHPTGPSKQPIRTRYLGHVNGCRPFRDQYFLIRSVVNFELFRHRLDTTKQKITQCSKTMSVILNSHFLDDRSANLIRDTFTQVTFSHINYCINLPFLSH